MALEGMRVADFTWAWAGPYCTKLLADLGAEVVKIETATRPDIGRMLPPFPDDQPGINRSGRYNKRNRGKLCVTIDLTQEQGVALARELIRRSDLVTENYSARVMRKFGLDYEAVREVKPDIVYLSLSAFGASGPHRDYVACGPNQAALAGHTYITGYAGGPPVSQGTALADPTAGLNGAVAALAALLYRRRTGKGQHIDLSQTEMFAALAAEPILEYLMSGRIPTRRGNRDRIMAPHNFYRCRGHDRWVSIAVATDEEWRALCRAMGDPPWSSDERFADAFGRWRNQEELDGLIEGWTQGHTHHELMEMLQRAGVAAMPAFDGEELFHDPHVRERGFLAEVEHPEVGRQTMPGLSMVLSHTPGHIRSHAPLLGQHNDYVFGELLGIAQQDIAALVAQGVIR